MTATGEVFNLKQLQGITGNYTAASAGGALAGGGTGTKMKNRNGVVIKVHATTAGVDLRLSIDGVSIKLLQIGSCRKSTGRADPTSSIRRGHPMTRNTGSKMTAPIRMPAKK